MLLFYESGSSAVWGVIIRNELRETMLTAWGLIPHFPNAATINALSMLNEIRYVVPVFYGPLQIGSDNNFGVDKLKEREAASPKLQT